MLNVIYFFQKVVCFSL